MVSQVLVFTEHSFHIYKGYLFFNIAFPKQAQVFTSLLYKSFENTVGKEEIARNEQFLLFSQCFLPCLKNFPPCSSNLKESSANSFSLEGLNFLSFGKELRPVFYIACIACKANLFYITTEP